MPSVEQLRSQREAILRIAARHGVRKIRLFGSVAKGTSRSESDIDLLVDIEPGRSLLDQVGFGQDLEELLGSKVDVVAEGGISPYLEGLILAEAKPL